MSDDWFVLRWHRGAVELLDQRRLPGEETVLRLTDVEGVANAIETLAVRGAPAIGVAAAFGVALAANTADVAVPDEAESGAALVGALDPDFARLAATRPTAVNLFGALERMRRRLRAAADPRSTAASVRAAALAEAEALLAETVADCRAIGAAGLPLVSEGARIYTHCNTGALATGGYGTALGVVRAAHEAGRAISVLAGETRPLYQGARLTAWELDRDGIPVTVAADSMAAHLMQRGEVDLVLVGADRIAANGDVANKIGTYGLAVIARQHRIPFYVAAPLSTVDLDTPDGARIPIEERAREEVAARGAGAPGTPALGLPEGVPVRNPAFDVTPAELVSAIVTERGLVRSPYRETLSELKES